MLTGTEIDHSSVPGRNTKLALLCEVLSASHYLMLIAPYGT